jgi:signal transduction histidine kinase
VHAPHWGQRSDAVQEQIKNILNASQTLPEPQKSAVLAILADLQQSNEQIYEMALALSAETPEARADLLLAETYFRSVPCPVLITNLDGVIVQSNPGGLELFDCAATHLVGRELCEVLMGQDDASKARCDQWRSQLLQRGQLLPVNTFLTAVDGIRREVVLRGCLLDTAELDTTEFDIAEGDLAYICWSLQDITQYKQTEQFLRQENAALLRQSNDYDAEVERILNFESMLKRITDRVRDSLDENHILQTVVRELTLVLQLGGCNSALYDLREGTSTISYEYTDSVPSYQGRTAQMDNFPEIYRQLEHGYSFQFCSLVPNPVRGRVAMLACPIFVDPASSEGIDQTVLGDLWLIHHHEHVFSASEIRLVQQVANQCAIAIRQARLYQAAQGQVRELEKLNCLKDEFLSTVSHELRTPIANAKMAVHMLKLATTPEKQQVYLNILESETTREADLIDELLDLQRLEASKTPVNIEVLYLQEWLPTVVEPFRFRCSDRQQSLRVEGIAQPFPMACDFGLLQKILAELLNNACKYTSEDGEIVVTVEAKDPSPVFHHLPLVQIFICNQAEIPQEELPHIFEKFYRVIQTDRYRQGGTGLGLALAQKRVEQLGGTIAVDSSDGWTTFTIILPNPLSDVVEEG